ncbi:Transcriptional regulator, TetR family protein [Vibrio orientalis CIP 102891 = ATCC 33934]|uniref:Transcriptional regulator TetR family n=1 Tax=Vibrio orientalis CIP 102891 = ATCC 33934 TaxID=675816 RepID=C9QF26_VIBOR|nr:TetR/AcrR family transcriptional regulator [Vibrio orientalis]EEX94736.1 transcriptional regulator TetR family [Vibrio orientalis CIP 102891 = ATCC 33934]EGU51435.1 Transcriptional regulator, TetR family protein [Vibrio orientalis CIP 102891 = ATCC 33934]
MGKTAKFDREQVINQATDLYWQKGFHATSMRNLQDVIDMRPGSIYAAFGSKDGLFKEALNNYTQMGIVHLTHCLDEASSPLEGLKEFIKHIVINTKHGAPNGMCMLAKTIAELNDEHQELLEEAKQCFKKMEHTFVDVLNQAQQHGEISPDKDPAMLARHLQVQIAGLRTYAKANDDDALLQEMIDDIFTHHPF